MPTYQYACTSCDARIEVVQKFSDDPLTECAACGSRLRKVFSPVGIVFKGSGFYRTDSRATANGGANGSGSKDETKDKQPAAAGESNSTNKSDSAGDSSKSGDSKTSGESKSSGSASKSDSGKRTEKVA